jgi:hypothetical protein
MSTQFYIHPAKNIWYVVRQSTKPGQWRCGNANLRRALRETILYEEVGIAEVICDGLVYLNSVRIWNRPNFRRSSWHVQCS